MDQKRRTTINTEEKPEILRRKPMILYRCEYEICENCLNCRHFLWTWDNIPFCGLGRNIYGFCFESEPRKNEVVDYD